LWVGGLLLLLLSLRCRIQIAAGEPLLLSYGKLSNDFLLMDYGFVVLRNEHDRVALRFDIELIKVRLYLYRVLAPNFGCRAHLGCTACV
jgi:hypothetical protein